MKKKIAQKIKTWQLELVSPNNDGFVQLSYLKKLLEIKKLLDGVDFKKEAQRLNAEDLIICSKNKSKKVFKHSHLWWQEEETMDITDY